MGGRCRRSSICFRARQSLISMSPGIVERNQRRSRWLLSSRMLKNSRDRLLTRVARNRAHAFAIICPTGPFFQHPVKRVLIVTATTGYQTRSFFEAAKRTGIEVTLATDRCHVLDDPWGDHAIPIRFENPEIAAEVAAATGPVDGVVGLGDRAAYIASLAAERLGVPFHPPRAVEACNSKFLLKERFQKAGLPVPGYRLIPLADDPGEAARATTYPCVLKPL